MNLLELRLINFLSHKDTSVKFSDGLWGILGLNGSGKSSLIKDAITWCLWGEARGGGAGDSLIHEDQDFCTVSIKLEISQRAYSVTRKRERNKKTVLKLESNDLDISGVVIKDTQKKINILLGMTYDVFKNSCCIEQGEADSFSKLSPKEAADVLLNILQLSKYWGYKVAATDKFMVYKSESDKLILTKDVLETEIHEIKNIDLVRKCKTAKLETLQNSHKALLDKYKKAEEQYNNIQKKIGEREKLQVLGNTELTNLNKQFTTLEKRLALLSKVNGHCPLCETSLSPDKKTLIEQKYVAEYQDLKEKITTLVTNLGLDQDTINAWKHNLTTFKLTEKATGLAKLETEMNTLIGELHILEQDSQLEPSLNELVLVDSRLEELKQQESIYSDLAVAFSSKGIPLLIVDNLLRELEVLINNNLSLLSDLSITVELNTQRESTKGELIDTFQILINNDLETRPYFNYSGGERLIIDLAIRLGISELLARRNNFKIETLIIDEGLGSLDDNNQAKFFETLTKLTKKFRTILVITHTSVKEYFSNIIELTKVNGVSRVHQNTNLCTTRGQAHEKTN